MIMKQGTIAAQIREKIDLIAALVQSPKPVALPTEETLSGIDGAQDGSTLQTVLDMNQALWQMKSALDELTAAFDHLCDRYNKLTGQEDGIDDPSDD